MTQWYFNISANSLQNHSVTLLLLSAYTVECDLVTLLLNMRRFPNHCSVTCGKNRLKTDTQNQRNYIIVHKVPLPKLLIGSNIPSPERYVKQKYGHSFNPVLIPFTSFIIKKRSPPLFYYTWPLKTTKFLCIVIKTTSRIQLGLLFDTVIRL